jgi:hypothetical protein
MVALLLAICKFLKMRGERMVTQFVSSIEPSLSTNRLLRYSTDRANPKIDLDALVNYFWNIALAESLFCSVNAAEIALRNSIHETLSTHFGTSTWYDNSGLLEPDQSAVVASAKTRILSLNRPVTPGRVVASLHFGFWVTILSRNYDTRLWRANNSANLRTAFPRVPGPLRQRVTIHQRYNEIRELRNRCYHHEPVFDDPKLLELHERVHYAIHWINPELEATTEYFDRFSDVFTNGRAEVDTKLRARIVKRHGASG